METRRLQSVADVILRFPLLYADGTQAVGLNLATLSTKIIKPDGTALAGYTEATFTEPNADGVYVAKFLTGAAVKAFTIADRNNPYTVTLDSSTLNVEPSTADVWIILGDWTGGISYANFREEAKVMIGPPVQDSIVYDDLLDGLIAGILQAADEEMGIGYQEKASSVVLFDGEGSDALYLPHANVAVTQVRVFNAEVFTDSLDEWTIIDPADYKVYAARGVIRGYEFPVGNQNVEITYSGGYADNAYPASLRRKLIKQTVYEFRRRNDPGLAAVSFPDGIVQKLVIAEWLPDVQDELDRRRRFSL